MERNDYGRMADAIDANGTGPSSIVHAFFVSVSSFASALAFSAKSAHDPALHGLSFLKLIIYCKNAKITFNFYFYSVLNDCAFWITAQTTSLIFDKDHCLKY